MGQEMIYTVMPRINFTPSQLAYNRRVSKSDRSQCRNYGDEEQTDFEKEYTQEEQARKIKAQGYGRGKVGASIDENV